MFKKLFETYIHNDDEILSFYRKTPVPSIKTLRRTMKLIETFPLDGSACTEAWEILLTSIMIHSVKFRDT